MSNHPQGADGELDNDGMTRQEIQEFFKDKYPELTQLEMDILMGIHSKDPCATGIWCASELGDWVELIQRLIKEHHKPQPVGDGDIDVSNKLGDGELRERIDQILFSVKSWNYGGEGAARQKTALDEIMTLIAAQTDAAQRELLERLKLQAIALNPADDDRNGKDYTEQYVSVDDIDAELQHLKSQESGKG